MNLPPEILTMIFGHLDANTLKSCLMLSKDVRSLIINTPQLMGKLPVIFFGTWQRWQAKIPFVDQNADRIRAITFQHCSLDGGRNNFVKILKKTKNLEELILHEMEWCRFWHYNKREYEELKEELFLPKLTTLSISLNSLGAGDLREILQRALKNVTSLKTFRIQSYDYLDPCFIKFVVKQNGLETLTIAATLLPWESYSHIEDCKSSNEFKLKVLEVGCLYYNECFFNFLLKQSSTIQELRFVKSDFLYFRLMLNNFRNIKKLSLSADQLLNDVRAQEIRNLRMPSVTELNIIECSKEAEAMRVLLNLFPNLETMSTPLESFSLHGIIENMPKLQKLDLNPCRLEMMCFAKSLSLKELKITNLRRLMVGAYWKKLAKDCPDIERLIVVEIDRGCIASTLDIEVALILQNLKHFKKLRFCQLVNKIGRLSWCYVVSDRGRSPTDEVANINQIFRLEREADKPTELSITNYFNNFHAAAIEKIVEEFDVNEVVIIPDPHND